MKKTTQEVLDSIQTSKEDLEFLPTGFSLIDKELDGGFLRKELVVLGAKTGIGKSIIGGQIMYHLATKGFRCAYFSLEISNEMVVSRMIGAIANIKPILIMTGKEKSPTAVGTVMAHSSSMEFYDDVYTLEEIKKEIHENAYEFVVVDFIQNVFAQAPDEYSRMSLIALQLQETAKKENCCLLVLSQLSNAMGKSGKSDSVEYKGSGSIATVCDLGFFIERQDSLTPETNILAIYLRKNRRGRSGIGWEYTYHHPGGKIT